MLEHEVADERVRDRVLDRFEPVAGDEAEVDVRRRHGRAGALEHPVGDVDGDDAVEALGEHAGHAPRAAADLDADTSPRVGAQPPEQALELRPRGRRVADELVDAVGRGRRVPRRPHPVPGHRQRVRLR